MKDNTICDLAVRFRKAIEIARDKHLFVGNIFDEFPNNCCGDTSFLLAEFFRRYSINCLIVSGEDDTYQTHLWLVIQDDRVTRTITPNDDNYDNITRLMSRYSSGVFGNPSKIHYTEDDIKKGLIIDITADQFGQMPVYVGYSNDFYKKFTANLLISEYDCLNNKRLETIFNIILSNMQGSKLYKSC